MYRWMLYTGMENNKIDFPLIKNDHNKYIEDIITLHQLKDFELVGLKKVTKEIINSINDFVKNIRLPFGCELYINDELVIK